MRLMQSHKSAAGRRSERRGSVRKSVGIAPVCLFSKILFHKEAGRLPAGWRRRGAVLCPFTPVHPSVRLSDGPHRSRPQPAPPQHCLLQQHPLGAVFRMLTGAPWPPPSSGPPTHVPVHTVPYCATDSPGDTGTTVLAPSAWPAQG